MELLIILLIVLVTILCIFSLITTAFIFLPLLRRRGLPASEAPVSAQFEAPPMTKEELAKERKKFEDEMAAFDELMNFNADKAYGIDSYDDK